MNRPIAKIYDCESGATIEREMNDAEFAIYEADQANFIATKAEAEAKADAKAAAQSKLAALGLTVEDLTALGL